MVGSMACSLTTLIPLYFCQLQRADFLVRHFVPQGELLTSGRGTSCDPPVILLMLQVAKEVSSHKLYSLCSHSSSTAAGRCKWQVAKAGTDTVVAPSGPFLQVEKKQKRAPCLALILRQVAPPP